MSLGFPRAQALHLRKGGRLLGIIVVLLLVSLLLASSSLADSEVDCTPGKRAALHGHVNLQGRPPAPDWRWVTILIVGIHNPPPDCSHARWDLPLITDRRGDFLLPNVPVGTFMISVKGFHTLRVCQTVTIVTGINKVDFGTLLEGDANNDNRIDNKDKAILLAAYGTHRGQRRYDPRADFNDDGKVDSADKDLLTANWNQVGCQLCP